MKRMKWWQFSIVAALVSACSTPFCNAPGGLCAPGQANTSAVPAPVAASRVPAVTPAPPATTEAQPEVQAAEVFAVQLPPPAPSTGTNPSYISAPPAGNDAAARARADAATSADNSGTSAASAKSGPPLRIALLLPLQAEALAQAAAAVRDGVQAAWQREPDNITLTAIATSDVPQDVLYSYAHAVQQYDVVIGPLSRAAVGTLAESVLVTKPTIALNYPEGHSSASPLPPLMLAMGLSLEDEARQLARRALQDGVKASASIVSTTTAWQRRVASAFADQWQDDGKVANIEELGTPDGEIGQAEILQWYARLRTERPGLLFSAMGAEQTRHVLAVLADADAAQADPVLPRLRLYGTSALNNGSALPALNGLRLLDLPWSLQPDHAAVMSYPHPTSTIGPDLERLYALGIDAYRVARAISRQPDGVIRLDGVTGQLRVDFGHGPARFERHEAAAEFRNGQPQVLIP
ncbi:penicillin-binding protein activator [Pseudoduganella danionis]|uniref:LppC family lipoprotein n=1 Tax=Pseudoduganella danionis TaxID=1890295 RepID=A0ABW9SQD0_9BURK|nr:penicillin-binding protein activator [Pseudoduganella danionis]MTW34291.1 LppC family lipoprotein [Pseudoduganella danionis]